MNLSILVYGRVVTVHSVIGLPTTIHDISYLLPATAACITKHWSRLAYSRSDKETWVFLIE